MLISYLTTSEVLTIFETDKQGKKEHPCET